MKEVFRDPPGRVGKNSFALFAKREESTNDHLVSTSETLKANLEKEREQVQIYKKLLKESPARKTEAPKGQSASPSSSGTSLYASSAHPSTPSKPAAGGSRGLAMA